MVDFIFILIMIVLLTGMSILFRYAISVTDVRVMKKINLIEKSDVFDFNGAEMLMNSIVCAWKDKIFEVRAAESQLIIVSGDEKDTALGFEKINDALYARLIPTSEGPVRIFMLLSKCMYNKQMVSAIAEKENQVLLFTESKILAKRFGFKKAGKVSWAGWVPKDETSQIMNDKTKISANRIINILLDLYAPEKIKYSIK